jgi:hypothetical protein
MLRCCEAGMRTHPRNNPTRPRTTTRTKADAPSTMPEASKRTTVLGARFWPCSAPLSPNTSTRWSYPKEHLREFSIVPKTPFLKRSSVTWVSRSPASAASGPQAAPCAYTSSMSLPTRKRAMSKSWLDMSRKMPPVCMCVCVCIVRSQACARVLGDVSI